MHQHFAFKVAGQHTDPQYQGQGVFFKIQEMAKIILKKKVLLNFRIA